jgi:hypothetical protein
MAKAQQSKVKIHGNLIHEIKLDEALLTMQTEDSLGFMKRVKQVYVEEVSFGIPSLDSLAYRVFFDYYEPYIHSNKKSRNNRAGSNSR